MSESAEEGISTLDKLMQIVQERGYLVTDDLLTNFPLLDEDDKEGMAELEEIFFQLINQGIEVYADLVEAEEERKFKAVRTETHYDSKALALPETQIKIGYLSPSFGILQKLLLGGIKLDTLHWREFEELVAELLEKDGYNVELGKGSKDGGIDIIAVKDLGEVGLFQTVWQAKKKSLDNKVGLSVIRELADSRTEYRASKAMIVTTTYLTKGALDRVRRDSYILGKVDRDDLMIWSERIMRETRR
jgi:restriction endonuclease Mrr